MQILFKYSLIAALAFLLMALGLCYYLGFQHVPGHVDALMANLSVDNIKRSASYYLNVSTNAKNLASTDITDATEVTEVTSVDAALPVPELPTDTVALEARIKIADSPFLEEYKAELARVKGIDFSKLVVAINSPNDKDVHQSLIQRYQEELINLLKEYDAQLKVGKCFDAPLQEDETARVTCMVTCFNSKGDNLGNISMPLTTTYDFVQYKNRADIADPEEWYVTDFSQEIPYDYVLNK
jgi:hypothetical protein